MPLPDRRATRRLGRAIASVLSGSELVLLEGPLGAGKTFLVRAICRALGVPPDVRVTSPTFTLVHEYPARIPLRHADLYRVTRAPEVSALGLLEERDRGAVLLVEWGAQYEEILGGDALVVALSLGPRSARLRGTGPSSGQHMAAIEGVFSPDPGLRSRRKP